MPCVLGISSNPYVREEDTHWRETIVARFPGAIQDMEKKNSKETFTPKPQQPPQALQPTIETSISNQHESNSRAMAALSISPPAPPGGPYPADTRDTRDVAAAAGGSFR